MCRSHATNSLFAVDNNAVVKLNFYNSGYAGWTTETFNSNGLATHCITISDNRGDVVVGGDNSTLFIRNGNPPNVYYTPFQVGQSGDPIYCLDAYDNIVIGGGENGLLFTAIWQNNVWTFTDWSTITNFHIYSVSIAPTATGYLVGAFGEDGFNYISDDLFASQFTVPFTFTGNINGSHFCSDGTNVSIVLGGNNPDIYQSFDNGITFNPVTFGTFDIQNILSKLTDEIFICGYNANEVYKTENNGTTWTQIDVPNNEVVNDIAYNNVCNIVGVGNNNWAYAGGYTQVIDLHQGWNLMSTYIHPQFPNCWNVFGPLGTNLKKVLNDDALYFNPLSGINQIGSIVDGEGYYLYVYNNDVLTINGEFVPNPVIELDQQDNFIAYLRTYPTPAEDIFIQLGTNLWIVTDEYGNVFIPAWINGGVVFNTIGDLKPGEGYKVKINNFPAYIDYSVPCGCN